MKQLSAIIVFLFLVQFVNAQKVNESDVPQAVKNEFSTLYKGAKAGKWIKEKNNYEAEFMVAGSEMSVLIDATGKLLETETEMPASALPQAVRDACAKNFVGKKIKEVAKIVDDKGAVKYEANIEGKDYLFDETGTLVN